MIKDIEGREINIGDECYMPYENNILRIRIVKETPQTIQYFWKRLADQDYRNSKDYMYKSGNPAKNLIKLV